MRLLRPTEGRIVFNGIDISAASERRCRPLRAAMQMVFQDPWSSLNPRIRVRRLIAEPLVLHANLSASERRVAVDRIAADHGFPPWRAKFQGQVAEGRLGGERVALLKPETFMNLSGQSVGEAMRFFKLEPGDVTVFHDEIDLPPARLKVKTGGGHAGHNGLRSIAQRVDHQACVVGQEQHGPSFGLGGTKGLATPAGTSDT